MNVNSEAKIVDSHSRALELVQEMARSENVEAAVKIFKEIGADPITRSVESILEKLSQVRVQIFPGVTVSNTESKDRGKIDLAEDELTAAIRKMVLESDVPVSTKKMVSVLKRPRGDINPRVYKIKGIEKISKPDGSDPHWRKIVN